MNHTVAKLKIKFNTPPGVARAKAEFELDLKRMASKDRRDLSKQVRELRREAELYAEIIINAYSRLGQAWVAKSGDLAVEGKDKKKRKVQRVRFEQCFMQSERIYYKLAINRRKLGVSTKNVLPHRVTVNELTSTETLFELSHACTRLVTAIREDYTHGVWIIVNRGVGADGVPLHVNFSDMLELLADAYDVNYFNAPVVVGAGQYRKPYILQFSSIYPHWLVAGTSGGGKSNALNSMLCTWLRFVDSSDLKLILVDLKRLEFRAYRDVPHLMVPVITDGETAVNVLSELMGELFHRTDILSEGKFKELDEWNKAHPTQKLARIVVIIDELAELMLSSEKEVRAAIIKLLNRISNLGRAVGVHIIAATQLPTTRVIPREITGNMTARLGARTASWHESLLIVGNGSLQHLPAIKGRMIFKTGPDDQQVQTPHVQPEDIKDAIAIAMGRKAGVIYLQAEFPMLDPEGAVCYIADHLKGNLGPQSLALSLGKLAVPQKQLIAMLQELTSKGAIAAKGRTFDVVRGARSYKLVERIEESAEPMDAPFDMDFTIDPESTLSRLRLVAPEVPELLMLPAPGETSSEGAPVPTRKQTKAPEPEPLNPLLMTDDQIVDKFIAERCTVSVRNRDSAANLHAAYTEMCKELDVLELGKPRFGVALKRRGFKQKRIQGKDLWTGVQVLEGFGAVGNVGKAG